MTETAGRPLPKEAGSLLRILFGFNLGNIGLGIYLLLQEPSRTSLEFGWGLLAVGILSNAVAWLMALRYRYKETHE